MTDTSNQAYVDNYFQAVQEKIKEILSKDKKIRPDQIQEFNDRIFTQEDYDARKDIQDYVDSAAKGDADINVIAQQIIERYYDMVFQNNFNKDTVNDVDNMSDMNNENKLFKFSQFIKESNSKKTYYIPWNGWFDFNDYDIDKMNEVLSLFLTDIPWTEKQSGQNEKPEVVCFLANYNIIPKISEKLGQEFDTKWIKINEKDW